MPDRVLLQEWRHNFVYTTLPIWIPLSPRRSHFDHKDPYGILMDWSHPVYFYYDYTKTFPQ